MKQAVRVTRKEYTDNRKYKIKLALFEYGDGSNKVERMVYGSDGYYRPALSFDSVNVDQSVIDKIKDS